VRDGLTGIANRRRFDEFLQKECLRSARENTPLSLLLVDIDYFKPYNDNYGHLAGDECLQTVASALSEAMHRPADLIARYGGEEFGVVLPNTDIDGAISKAEDLQAAVNRLKIPHNYSGTTDHITISIGVTSQVVCEKASPSVLITAADEALYEAKEAGRNQYKVSAGVENN
jgi:diguanylate cyclase (GGDEF)-like protein